MSGPLAGGTIEVDEELVIGREDTDLAIDDREMSRRHAVVRRQGDRLQVEDLGSTNGTFVDGTRITEPTLLGGGTEIKVGTTVLMVEGVLPLAASDPGVGDAARNLTRVSPAVSATAAARRTSQSSVVSKAGTMSDAPAAPTVAAPPGRSSQPAQPVGAFDPPRHRRHRALASRSWIPVVLSFATVIVVAIALVIYFSQHT